MSATIEKSLCIGWSKTRFDLYDNIQLKLLNKEVVLGQIIDISDTSVTIEKGDLSTVKINVSDIDTYIPLTHIVK